VETQSGSKEDRLSPYATYVVEPPKVEGTIYKHKFWNPPSSEVRGVSLYFSNLNK
jgi:hypothetical protein